MQARIEQAEVGGCPEGLLSDAKQQLHRLLLAEVKAELEAVLKLGRAGAERSVAQRLSSLKASLWCCYGAMHVDTDAAAANAVDATMGG